MKINDYKGSITSVKLPREAIEIVKAHRNLPKELSNKDSVLYIFAMVLSGRDRENFMKFYDLDERIIGEESNSGMMVKLEQIESLLTSNFAKTTQQFKEVKGGLGYTHRQMDSLTHLSALSASKSYRGSVEFRDLMDEYEGTRLRTLLKSTESYLKQKRN